LLAHRQVRRSELNIDRALTAEPNDREAWIETTVRLRATRNGRAR